VIVALALAAVFLAMFGLLVEQLQQKSPVKQDAALPPAPIVGRRSPNFTLKALDGRQITLSSFRGKPVWVNFWATWCPPCRAEMPEMQQLYNKYREEGLVIIGIDSSENAGTVKEFLESNGYDWTFVLDDETRADGAYRVSAIPQHVFIGRDGVITAVHLGGISGKLMDHYVGEIVD
jgi:thiol-disulfide isomerase/thioredoxin